MGRLLSLMIVGVITGALLGCQPKGVDKKIVERAMSGQAGINVEQNQVASIGEPAIPVIFEILREHWDEEPWGVHFMDAQTVIRLMVGMGTADPSAPYIRRILADRKEKESLRVAAAQMLIEFDRSPEPRRALIDRIKHDTSEEVRVACIMSLGGNTVGRFYPSKTWQVHPDVQWVLFLTMRDKSAKIRKQTCNSVAGIASEPLYEGVELAWCRQLLIQARSDKEYSVRKAAVDALSGLDQEKAKHKSLRQM